VPHAGERKERGRERDGEKRERERERERDPSQNICPDCIATVPL